MAIGAAKMSPQHLSHRKEQLSPTAAALYRILRSHDRSPFLEALSVLLDAMPDRVTLEDFARSHPDKFVGMVKTLAGLGGFADRIDLGLSAPIEDLSDAQLEARIREQMAKLGMGQDSAGDMANAAAGDGKIIDATFAELPSPEATPSPAPERG